MTLDNTLNNKAMGDYIQLHHTNLLLFSHVGQRKKLREMGRAATALAPSPFWRG